MRIKHFLLIGIVACFPFMLSANPIKDLLERIEPGASGRFIVQLEKSEGKDFFELDQKGDKVVIRGNTYVNIATGLNWYLKYYAGIHLSWNNMQAHLPASLPKVARPERHETDLTLRYDFNYCTYSYTMAFWDWNRWEKEIDWMALHGINLPLAAVGQECVWRNMLIKLGYTKEEINRFIAGPAFLAWWAMNNLEGWGGPNPDSWYTQQEALQKKILKRMREYGIEPVLPGYSGMVPHDANKKLGLNVTEPELWNGFTRPAFLLPTDSRFAEIAALYYDEQKKLFGKANYYSMDPFHECENAGSIDFDAAGKAVLKAMHEVNPKAVWVVQGWTENPRPEMIKNLKNGDLLILDLFSECRPMWGIPSIWKREKGYEQHDWLFCLLENFGGNVGLHGRFDQLLNNFYLTKNNPLAAHLKGIGLTMEGIEQTPVIYALMLDNVWRDTPIDTDDFLHRYISNRYGKDNASAFAAWRLLFDTVFENDENNGGQESIITGRPSFKKNPGGTTTVKPHYDNADLLKAWDLLVSAADSLSDRDGYRYDIVDVSRQALVNYASEVQQKAAAAFRKGKVDEFNDAADDFLELISDVDTLLATRQEFLLGRWLESAKALGTTPEESALYERNARNLITMWGNKDCYLADYACRQWSGMMNGFYRERWKLFFDDVRAAMESGKDLDMEKFVQKCKDWEWNWISGSEKYPVLPAGDEIEQCRKVYAKYRSRM